MADTGTLYIISTPIGNLEDITQRAQRILHQVHTIVAEDTRHTNQLLKHLGIQRPLMSYHAHNEDEKTSSIIQMLNEGHDIALVSDAGTPLISDPGFPLVRAAQAVHIQVVPVPGACALIAALSASGLSPMPFYFAGFLSPKDGPRMAQLKDLQSLSATLIFYEAPHRLLESLRAMEAGFGNRMACLARELTKQFETIIRLPLQSLIARVAADPNQQKGEAVILIEGNATPVQSSDTDRFLTVLLRDMPLKQAVAICVELTGEPKNAVYEKALALKK